MSALLDIMENNVINQNFVIGSRNEKTNIQIINQICNICYTHFKKKYNYKLLINYVEDRLGHDQRYAINPDLIENQQHLKNRNLIDFDYIPKNIVEDIIKEFIKVYN